jgi:3'(2'), 5'-bisphosphate nucleotidase
MDTNILKELLTDCRDIARQAGLAIKAIAEEPQDDLGVQAKEDGSPLTRADRASHDIIVQGLAAMNTPFPVLSEEGKLEEFQADPPEVFWCVDPLDGTKEFIKGLDEYTVNIALVRDAQPILGVVYAPALERGWCAAEGCGAWCRSADGTLGPIKPVDRRQPRTAVVSRSHLDEATEAFLKRNHIEQSLPHGSSIKLTAVAEGTADVYPRYGPTCLWDTAAGCAVARQAGCKVIDLDGNDLSYDPRAGLKREGFIVHPVGMNVAL